MGSDMVGKDAQDFGILLLKGFALLGGEEKDSQELITILQRKNKEGVPEGLEFWGMYSLAPGTRTWLVWLRISQEIRSGEYSTGSAGFFWFSKLDWPSCCHRP
jgi:hypothetical protein